MKSVRLARTLLALGAAALAVAAPAWDSAARPKKPPPVVYVPPPPPPPPPVGLSERLIADAAAYEAYVTSAGAIAPAFVDGPSVANALKAGASYQDKALIRGAIAYGAIAALQDRDFVATVRSFGQTAESRAVVVNAIYANPSYALAFEHAAVAAAYAKQALNGQAMRLFNAGKAVKQSAYDVQRLPWSKEPVENRDGRLAGIKTLSSVTAAPPAERIAALRLTVTGPPAPDPTAPPPDPTAPPPPPAPAPPPPPPPAKPPFTPLIAHAMSLAALAALGEAGEANGQRVSYLMSEANTDLCVNMAKLNLYQCLAVAKPHYEDIFCLGQHAMIDTGVCLAKYTGAILPLEVNPPPLKVPTPKIVKPRPRPRRR